MRGVSPRSRVLLVLGCGLLLAGWSLAVPAVGAPADASSGPPTQPTPTSVKIVPVDANSSDQLWPYTARRRSFDAATLPVNVVVLRDAAYVRYLLSTSVGARWQVADPPAANASAGNGSSLESGVVLNGSRIDWTVALGSTRYVYVHDERTGRGRWIDETYQLHDGAYLGSRYHLRLYEGGAGRDRWTAIQVHREHWDWFRLRHTVDSVDRAQDVVEREFFGTWFAESVRRDRYANGGALDADGWVTVVHLTDRPIRVPAAESVAVVLWLASMRRLTACDLRAAVKRLRTDLEAASVARRYLPLVAVLGLLPLAVRLAGVTLELTFTGLSPKVVAGVLYPLLVLGVPVTAYCFSRDLEAQTTAVAAAAALGAGMLLDYRYLGIAALSIDLLLHRTVLLVAVGMIAAGAARSSLDEAGRHWLLTVGALVWVLGLLIPLFGLS